MQWLLTFENVTQMRGSTLHIGHSRYLLTLQSSHVPDISNAIYEVIAIFYCPNCHAAIEDTARECSSCQALFDSAIGWKPISKELMEMPPEKEPPLYLAWFIFSPFLIVVATALVLFFVYGPAGPWVTLRIAPFFIAGGWVAIWLHAWHTTYDLPKSKRRGEMSKISIALLCGGLCLLFLLLR